MKIKTLGALILIAASCAPLLSGQIVYVGTYTRTSSKGIYAWRLQPATGKLTPLGLAAETSNPTFLAVAPNQRFLYAANEDKVGTIGAFAIDGTLFSSFNWPLLPMASGYSPPITTAEAWPYFRCMKTARWVKPQASCNMPVPA